MTFPATATDIKYIRECQGIAKNKKTTITIRREGKSYTCTYRKTNPTSHDISIKPSYTSGYICFSTNNIYWNYAARVGSKKLHACIPDLNTDENVRCPSRHLYGPRDYRLDPNFNYKLGASSAQYDPFQRGVPAMSAIELMIVWMLIA